ncbi:hypothetical protein GOY07_02615 [Wolbachia endosymbiont of Litomosoides sigmodontis]|uniref:hypothetical protein n=1 Tax=Wolbachia endosymbiont of Litomosoides sigmodontis TaxID=80850 RepID=UPI00158944D0|nr:hypothetical protein [Wolbachia endosymbiont of Litomosoides sigmodontis]QKX03076.1 hypothetical protein GOY07_02615 [Wolbachia endosymbiont of Litomosoides sigmodontis]
MVLLNFLTMSISKIHNKKGFLNNESKNSEEIWLLKNVSKSTLRCNVQKMKSLYITPKPICNEQDEGRKEELKN